MDDRIIFLLIVCVIAGYATFVGCLLRMVLPAPAVEEADAASESAPWPQSSDEVFFLDLASRFNEAILANNDAADTVLFAVLGATAVFAALAVDKIKELELRGEHLALALLVASAVASITGYVLAFLSRDGIEPTAYVAEVTVSGKSVANASALAELMRRSRRNLTIRTYKRILVLVAVTLSILGGSVVAYVRAGGPAPSNGVPCDRPMPMVVR